MKFLIFNLVLIFSVSAFSKLKLANWELKNDFKTTKVWRHKKDQNLYVSIEKASIPNEKEYKAMLEKSSTSLDKHKSKVLGLIGISDWNAETKKWKKIGKKRIFQIKGTYSDSSDEQVYFEEYHKIEGETAMKVLFTSSNQNSLKKSKEINQFLKAVKTGEINE